MESEVAAAFLATLEAIPIRIALEEMGHKQPPNPLQVDNTNAVDTMTASNIAVQKQLTCVSTGSRTV